MYDFSALREFRKKRGWTIKALSERAGVSAVALSKLERNQGNPELRTLDRLARALEVATYTILAMAERRRPVRLDEERTTVLDGATCRYVDFDGTRVCWVKGQRGQRGNDLDLHGEDFEHCFVLEGRLKVCVRGSDYEVKAGEGLTWDCLFEHEYEMLEPTTFVAVLEPKRI